MESKNNKEERMLELTFGEQVKIILSRKGMTIKELAEKIEKTDRKEDVASESDPASWQR